MIILSFSTEITVFSINSMGCYFFWGVGIKRSNPPPEIRFEAEHNFLQTRVHTKNSRKTHESVIYIVHISYNFRNIFEALEALPKL